MQSINLSDFPNKNNSKQRQLMGLIIKRGGFGPYFLAALLGLFIFCSQSLDASGQVSTKTLSLIELKEDFSILRQTFEKAHAGLYRYTVKKQIDSAFDKVGIQLKYPMSELKFFRLIAPLINLIHDNHTSLRPSTEILKFIAKTAKVFPLVIRYEGGQAFVEKNLSPNRAIPVATEIVSINGVPMAQVTDKVISIKSTDGMNRITKYEVAGINFWINYFEMVDTAGNFSIEIRDTVNGKITRYSTEGVSAQLIQNAQFNVQSHTKFSLDFLKEGKVALMSIPSFSDLPLMIAQFSDAFKQIKEKGSPTLIIDIRNNTGGDDQFNTELLSYLVPHPFKVYKGFTFRAENWDDIKYIKYSPDDFWNTADFTKYTDSERIVMLKQRTLAQVLAYNSETNPAAGIHFPKPANNFSGNLFLLINGRTQSTGGEIPALLHFLGVGTLIGEEPNAAYQGTAGGIILTLTLPHSGIRLNVPLFAYHNAVLPGLFPSHGVTPHFVVSQTLEDAIKGHDTVLEFTLALINARYFDNNR
jgi:hypothetical protein